MTRTLDIDPREPPEMVLDSILGIAQARRRERDEAPTTIAYQVAAEAMDDIRVNLSWLGLLTELCHRGSICGDEILDYLDHARLSYPAEDRGTHVLIALCQRSLEEYLNEEFTR